MADQPGTLGEPDADKDSLSTENFPGWSHLRQCRLTLDDVGGVVLRWRAQPHRCELSIICDYASSQAIESTLMSYVEGTFQIPSPIETPRFSAHSSIHGFYVQRMYRFLRGVSDDLANQPVIITVDIPPIRR